MSRFGILYDQRHENNRIFVSAKEIILHQYDPRLSASVPGLFIVFEFFHRIRPERRRNGAVAGADVGHEARVMRREFRRPFESFASAEEARPAVEAMMSVIELPFHLENGGPQLRWKDDSGYDDGAIPDLTDASSVPLGGVGDVVAKVSEAAARVVASGMSRGVPLEMRVRIRKVTVVPAEDYAIMFEGYDDEDEAEDLSDEIAMYNSDVPVEGLRFRHTLEQTPPPRLEGDGEGFDYEDLLDEVAVFFDVPMETLRFQPIPAQRQPPALAVAAKEDGLETVRYEGGGSDDGDDSTLTCSICIDEVLIGSNVTRLPCSHKFHGDCIGKWLQKSSTCPLCRSKFAHFSMN